MRRDRNDPAIRWLLWIVAVGTTLSLIWGVQGGRAKESRYAELDRLTIATQTTPTALCWSQDGRFIAVATEAGLRVSVFESTGRLHATMRRNNAIILSAFIAFAKPPDQVLFSGNFDGVSPNGLTVWNVATGQPIAHMASANGGDPFAISADRSEAVLQGRGQLDVFSGGDWRLLRSIKTQDIMSSMRFLPESTRFVAGDVYGRVYIGDTAAGTLRRIASPFHTDLPEGGRVDGSVVGLSISPDASRAVLLSHAPYEGVSLDTLKFSAAEALAYEQNFKPVQVVSLKDGRLDTTFPGKVAINGFFNIAWDPKNRFIAIVDETGSLVLWNPDDGRVTTVAPKASFVGTAVVFSPDGKWLAVAAKSALVILNANSLPRV